LQHQGGAEFGSVTNADLRQVLGYFASGYHQSFCIVTTRVPVIDLMAYSSYSELQVGRLTTKDGVKLLKGLAVSRPDAVLTRTVEKADGHALTLTLLAGYAAEYPEAPLEDAFSAGPSSDVHERLHALLRESDTSLKVQERQMLGIASTARRSVPLKMLSAAATATTAIIVASRSEGVGASNARGAEAPNVQAAGRGQVTRRERL
jgi:hypothetical protein